MKRDGESNDEVDQSDSMVCRICRRKIGGVEHSRLLIDLLEHDGGVWVESTASC